MVRASGTILNNANAGTTRIDRRCAVTLPWELKTAWTGVRTTANTILNFSSEQLLHDPLASGIRAPIMAHRKDVLLQRKSVRLPNHRNEHH